MISMVKKLNKKVCKRLWKLKNDPSSLPSGPYHPPYDLDGNPRISEQEARFCYAQLLHEQFNPTFSDSLTYSVETPTKQKYNHSTNSGNQRSALFDMSLYRFISKSSCCNIEFKCGCVESKLIKQDFEKLINEHVLGVFFHLIKTSDRNTLNILHKNFTNAMNDIQKSLQQSCANCCGDEKEDVLLITFCFLECRSPIQPKGWAVSKIYDINSNNTQDFFAWMIDPNPFCAACNAGWDCIKP